MSAKWDKSWIRIGRYDKTRRRSTWARIICSEDNPEDKIAVEICSGREGDDAFACVEKDDPAFPTLLSVIEYSIFNVDEEPDEDEINERLD